VSVAAFRVSAILRAGGTGNPAKLLPKESTVTEIKDMVEFVAKGLADQPDAVRVSESIGESTVAIEISIASDDVGRLIGRKGRTINAIRALARILGAKMEKKVNVEIG
jgi:uncharacterized protein